MKTLKFVTVSVVLIGAATIIALYLIVLAAGTTTNKVVDYSRACEALACIDHTPRTIIVKEQ